MSLQRRSCSGNTFLLRSWNLLNSPKHRVRDHGERRGVAGPDILHVVPEIPGRDSLGRCPDMSSVAWHENVSSSPEEAMAPWLWALANSSVCVRRGCALMVSHSFRASLSTRKRWPENCSISGMNGQVLQFAVLVQGREDLGSAPHLDQLTDTQVEDVVSEDGLLSMREAPRG